MLLLIKKNETPLILANEILNQQTWRQAYLQDLGGKVRLHTNKLMPFK